MAAARETINGGSQDSIFKEVDSGLWVKCGIDGFQGGGKSHTMVEIAIGIYQKSGLTGPVYLCDTEKQAKFTRPHLAKHGIRLTVVESQDLDVLQRAIAEVARAGGVLLIDSATKISRKLEADYKKNNNRTSIEIQDRPILNAAWEQGFEDPFVEAECHVLFTGRAAIDWGNEEIEDKKTGKIKRGFYAKGVKMAGHKETLFAPDYVIYMERQERLLTEGRKGKASEKEVWREATILKDRSTLLDGKTLRNPTFKDFEPMFDFLRGLKQGQGNQVAGDPRNIFGDDDGLRAFFKRRDIALEQLDGMLGRALPGQKAEEKQARLDCLKAVFGTYSKTAIEGLRPELIEESLPRVEAWLNDLARDKGVGSGAVSRVTYLDEITRLVLDLTQAGVTPERMIELCESAGGVQDFGHLQEGDAPKLIALLKAELTACEKPKRRNGNGSKKTKAEASPAETPPPVAVIVPRRYEVLDTPPAEDGTLALKGFE